MIIKHVPMRALKQSSFSGLAKYISDTQSMLERVGQMTITNCHSADMSWAIEEISATQAMNTRALGDKTYHLLVSFPEGENPSNEQLKVIEQRICASVGFEAHQRISVVHHDTDNLHIHIAINKIHPEKHTLHEPYRAYATFGSIAHKLETEYGLENTNHGSRKNSSENKADDMENHSGIVSLLNWVKKECSEELAQAQSWGELHSVLEKNGLEISERGNGFVIKDSTGIAVKASSVKRQLSKNSLEKKLGIFEPKKQRSHLQNRRPSNSFTKIRKSPPVFLRGKQNHINQLGRLHITGTNQYQKEPVKTRADTTELYSRYKTAQSNAVSQSAHNLSLARDKKNKEIIEAKRIASLKRKAIKLLKGQGVNKKLLYALTSRTLKNDIAKANNAFLKDRQSFYAKSYRRTWADWLKEQAAQGDKEALDALRARDRKKAKTSNGFEGRTTANENLKDAPKDNVTKSGTVIFRQGTTAIRDDGESIKVSRGATIEGVVKALEMAKARYGEKIRITGSTEFKELVLKVAAHKKLDIGFDDPDLERRRLELLNKYANEEFTNESRSSNRTGNTNSRRTTPSSPRPAEPTRANGTRFIRRRERGVRVSVRDIQPNSRGLGRKPPTEKTDTLRNLSELRMVHDTNGSQSILSGNVPNYMEQQGTNRNYGLRRSIRGTGRVVSGHLTKLAPLGTNPPPLSTNRLRKLSALPAINIAATPSKVELKASVSTISSDIKIQSPSLAADQYVQERETKRAKGFDIMKHHRYNDYNGIAVFAGLRKVGGQGLILFECEGAIQVMPIDSKSLNKIKRLSIGDQISVSPKGISRLKGRSR